MPILPAIVPAGRAAGAGGHEPAKDDLRSFGLSGVPAAGPVLRGALFEANGRGGFGPDPGSPSRPLSASLGSSALLNQALASGLARSGAAGAGPASPLSQGLVAGPPSGSSMHVQDAAQSASALRSLAETLARRMEAALRAREAQNRAMLTATREGLAHATDLVPPAPSAGRPASARALVSSLSSSRMGGGIGGADDRLAWVRTLVRQTDGGQAYAAATERDRPGSAEAGGGTADGSARRGPLPLPRPSRREDAVLLQSWLADTLQHVLAGAAAQQLNEAGGGALAGEGGGSGEGGKPGSEPSAHASAAVELADSALYVVGVAFEELKRQVAADCKERGELLSMLVEQLQGLGALRGALAGETRAADVAAQWAEALAERDRLAQQATEVPEASAALAAASTASGLAAQLVAAQRAAATAEKRFALADAALSGEVQRRTAAEQQLEAARELLRRQEEEWLRHRAANERYEAQVTALRDELDAAKRGAAVAEAAVTVASEITKTGKDDVAHLEAALARVRQQYEGNEILVVAQRQQVRELEAALAALREQHREQAVTLGQVGKVTEQYEVAASALRADLAAEQDRAAELSADLVSASTKLATTEADLEETRSSLAETRDKLAATEEAAAKAEADAAAIQRRLRAELADALQLSRNEETRRQELEKENTTLSELIKLVARTLTLQGMEGVPGVNDKTWATGGPLGAAQRVLGMTTQQLAMLYAHGEDLGRQLRAVTAKLSEEKEGTLKLSRELNEARTAEARMIREKEIADMRIAALEHDLRASQSDALKQRAAAIDSEARIKVQHETIVVLQAQVKELPPLKKRVEALNADLDASRKSEEERKASLAQTRQNLEQAEEQTKYFKDEVDRLLGEVANLQEEVRQLRVVAAKLDEEVARNKELEAQVHGLQHQLDVTAESHSETVKQLELAKWFLQGLEVQAGSHSPRASTSPTRDRAGPLSPSRMGLTSGRHRHPAISATTIDALLNSASSAAAAAAAAGAPNGGGADGAGGGGGGRSGGSGGGAGPSASGGSITGSGAAAPGVSGLISHGSASPPTSGSPPRPYSAINRGGLPPPVPAPTGGAGAGGGHTSPNATRPHTGGRPFSGVPPSSATAGLALAMGGITGRFPAGVPSPLASRPASAVPSDGPALDEEDSMYHTDVPTEVMEIMESRGLANKLASSNAKWANVKIGIMAWFSNKLRARLLAVTEQLAGKELEIAQLHVRYLTEMKEREEFIVSQLVPTLMPAIDSAMMDTRREVEDLRASMPTLRRDMDSLAASCAVVALSLKGYREREANAESRSCQTDSEAPDDWLHYASTLPPLPPNLTLSLGALADTIVRVYVRAGATVEDVPTWGPPRHDTIFDALMGHYTSQRAPGTFRADFIRDPESPVARLLSSALAHAKNTKVAMFLYFCNLSPEGVHWPSSTWHFFLHILHCLRVLLSGTWRVVTKRWASPEGVQIPMPAVLDLVGNIFNVQSPGDLDGAVSLRLAAIVTPSAAGPSVDLDALLLLLVREYNTGNCPRAPLLFPRRLTDGQLFNIFNTAGYNAHVTALAGSTANKFIGPQTATLAPSGHRFAPAAPPAAAAGSRSFSSPALAASHPGAGASGGLMPAPGTPPLAAPGPPPPSAGGDVLNPYHLNAVGAESLLSAASSKSLAAPSSERSSLRVQAQAPGDVVLPAERSGGSFTRPARDAEVPNGSLTVSFEISHKSAVVKSAVVNHPGTGGSQRRL